MSHSDQDIPTLTDFIRIGDEDMHHHFDAHQFRVDQDEPWASTDADASSEGTFSADAFSGIDLASDKTDKDTVTAEADSNIPADSDPLRITTMEVDQIPAELAPFEPALVEDDSPTDESDEYLELDVEDVISAEMPPMQTSADDMNQPPARSSAAIRQQIDRAVDELLPSVAETLKHKLYRHFQCQGDAD